jgi:CRP-like cAMP-binding protein
VSVARRFERRLTDFLQSATEHKVSGRQIHIQAAESDCQPASMWIQFREPGRYRPDSLEIGMNTNATSAVRRIERNTLLAALPSAERSRFCDDLELVPLALGEVLYESGQTMTHAYFPTDCVISLLYVMKNVESAEIAIVGNEGMVGIALFLGGESTMSRAIVQNAGHAYRLKAQVLKDEFARGKALMRSLLMFSSALITQMVQTAACNRHHTIDQQLCRWMLLSLDRLPTWQISMTAKLIGNMLGVQSDQVSSATDVLRRAGVIRYAEGEITVLNRAAVEKRSCECYEVVKKESDRLLARPPPLLPPIQGRSVKR